MKKTTLFLLLLVPFFAMAQPTSVPDLPSEDAVDVVSLFSDEYTSSATISIANFTPPGNTANIISAAGNNVYELGISGGPFHGFNLSEAVDLTNMENLHYDIWIEGSVQVGAVFNTTVSYHAGGHLTGQTTGYVDTNTDFADGDDGQWLSFDVPFSEFAPDMSMNPRDIISQIVFTHVNLSDVGPLYVDNIYFWREAVDPNADSSLSDLTVDGTTVEGFSPGVTSYDVELPSGTMTVPTVAATTTQAMATTNIMDAAMLPGSTTVTVTAPNGTDTTVYTINFTLGAALPATAAPTPPQRPVDDVVSVYSNAYTNVAPTGFIAFGSAAVTDVDIEMNPTLQWEFNNPGEGFQYEYSPGSSTEGLDLSNGFTKMHIDLYVSTGDDPGELILVQLLNWNGAGFDPVFINFELTTTGTGAWYSADVDLSSFINPAGSSLDAVQLVQIIGQGGVFGPVYIDNIYFHKETTLSTNDLDVTSFEIYPNPTTNNWTINGTSTIQSVKVYDILGKQVVSMTPNSDQVTVNATSLRDGVYFARVESENGSKTVKLIKK